FRILHLTTPPATPSLDTLSLHDALPISLNQIERFFTFQDKFPHVADIENARVVTHCLVFFVDTGVNDGHIVPCKLSHLSAQLLRSEEHTSELQSRENLVCRLLAEKKQKY